MKINSVNLSDVTTYRFGGICDNFISFDSESDTGQLVELCKGKNNVVLGKGSNIAFSDKKFKDNIISPQFFNIDYVEENQLKVGSSVYLPKLSRYFKNQQLSNGEFLIGIPGTVGGAIKMNAGAYGWEFSDLLINIDCFNLDSLEFETLNKEDMNFSYRSSMNLDNKIILGATLSIEKGDIKLINKNLNKFNKIRKESQPPAIYNAGSVFKNSENYYAGELIEQAGLKGYEIDGVSVSIKHANFFVARKNAKASALYKLVQHVKEVVYDKFSINLEEEIIFLGEFT